MAADPPRLGYGPERSGAPLPAPYQDPLSRLGEDLRAVLASLRLRLRELWRRNWQGDLTRPGFWPRDLAPLYWPLLLSCGLILIILLPWQLARLLPQRPTPLPQVSSSTADSLESGTTKSTDLAPGIPEAGAAASATDSSKFDSSSSDSGAVSSGTSLTDTLSPEAATAGAEGAASPSPEAAAAQAAEAEAARAAEAASATAAEAEMQLLAGFAQQDPGRLIAAAQADGDGVLLRLRMAEGYGRLSRQRRQTQAERWWQRSLELGYEQLQLRDGLGRLLARQARVGSGMILLDAGD
jgi:hypothetical protein